MDPGVDDAIMLLLAINDPNLEVLAVTAVSDNVNANKATTNVLKVIEASGRAYRSTWVPKDLRREDPWGFAEELSTGRLDIGTHSVLARAD